MDERKLLDPKIVAQTRDRPRLSDVAFEAIRDAVCSGRTAPGQWLRQETLAQELGVSQVTVREALNRLVAEGLAVHVPYKGVKTVALSIEDIVDIYEMRALLEGLAMELAATRISSKDLARMRELLPHTVVTSHWQSTEQAREANRAFHWIAISASGRWHLIRMLGQLWDLIDPYTLYSRFLVGNSAEQERLDSAVGDLRDHTRLLEALEARDDKRARQITVETLQGALDSLQALLSAEQE